jgi:protein PhnA
VSLEFLQKRASGTCEICESTMGLSVFDTGNSDSLEDVVLLCGTCVSSQKNLENESHWRALQGAIWSETPAVQVLSWRLLTRLSATSVWALEALGNAYLDEALLAKAKSGLDLPESNLSTLDSNGTPLQDGDTVTLIKGLDVKGANFTAKRGTTVKNIRLTTDPGLVEGRINKTSIVLKTEFLKRIG